MFNKPSNAVDKANTPNIAAILRSVVPTLAISLPFKSWPIPLTKDLTNTVNKVTQAIPFANCSAGIEPRTLTEIAIAKNTAATPFNVLPTPSILFVPPIAEVESINKAINSANLVITNKPLTNCSGSNLPIDFTTDAIRTNTMPIFNNVFPIDLISFPLESNDTKASMLIIIIAKSNIAFIPWSRTLASIFPRILITLAIINIAKDIASKVPPILTMSFSPDESILTIPINATTNTPNATIGP